MKRFKIKKALAIIAIAGMLLTSITLNVLAEVAVPTRINGLTAAQTAVEIAEQTGWSGTAILASSASYGMVDALTAGPLATFLKAPILLTEAGDLLNADTEAELSKLKVKTVYVTSGTGVISQAVLDQLTGMGISVVPLGGVDRFVTATNIANKMVELGANPSRVAVAYGWNNQDALSIAAIASAQTEPILLTEKDSIPVSVREFLMTHTSVKTTDVIGGTGVISDGVIAQLPSATRLYGNTAYDTNLAVLKAFESVLKYDHVFIANGETAIDALAGAPLAAKYNTGIVLTDQVTNEGTTYVSSKLSTTSVVTALGGTAVVPDVVRAGLVYVAPADSIVPVVPGSGSGSSGSSGSSGGGGGDDDDSSPVVTTANVSNAGELTTALANNSITVINFTASFTANPTVTRSLTMNFGAYTLTGDVSFDHTGTGTAVLTGNAGNRITGDLTVDTANASFNNGVKVGGAVNIVNVEIGTWTETANGNTLTITDSDGASITITGNPGSVTVTEDASGSLTLSVNAGATVENITSNAPINIVVATGATVSNITAAAGAGGTTITNNGSTGTLTSNVPINLVANVAPTTTITGASGSVVTSGTNANHVAVVSDVTVPVLSLTSASAITETTATLNFTTDEAGTYYYLVYAAADAAPNAATIKALGTAVTKGTAPTLAGAKTANVAGLTASTAYKAYVIVEDAAENASAVSTVALTTLAQKKVAFKFVNSLPDANGAYVPLAAGSVVEVKNGSTVITPTDTNSYNLAIGTYSYKVTATGYFTATGTINVALSDVESTTDQYIVVGQQENISAEPVITTTRQEITPDLGTSVEMTVDAASPDGGTLTYQWYTAAGGREGDEQLITGATQGTYIISSVTAADAGDYWVIVTNTKGTASPKSKNCDAYGVFPAVVTDIVVKQVGFDALVQPESIKGFRIGINGWGNKEFSATVIPESATNKSVIWTSSNPSVASIIQTGSNVMVTGLTVGEATITVTSQAVSNVSLSFKANVSYPNEADALEAINGEIAMGDASDLLAVLTLDVAGITDIDQSNAADYKLALSEAQNQKNAPLTKAEIQAVIDSINPLHVKYMKNFEATSIEIDFNKELDSSNVSSLKDSFMVKDANGVNYSVLSTSMGSTMSSLMLSVDSLSGTPGLDYRVSYDPPAEGATLKDQSGHLTHDFTGTFRLRGEISGTVINVNTTNPVAGAVVSLYRNDETTPFGGTIQTSSEGQFGFGRPLGSYILKVSAPGFIDKQMSIEFQINSTILEISMVPQLVEPGTVVGLQAIAGDGQIGLSWVGEASATFYKVYKASAVAGPYEEVDPAITKTDTNYIVSGLTNGTTYYFVVKASNEAGDGGNSNEVSAQPTLNSAPAAPTGVSASDNDSINAEVDGRDFTVNWTVSASGDVTSQEIYILPSYIDLNINTQTPVVSFANNTTDTWTGDVGVTIDSTDNTLSQNDYKVYVVAVNGNGKTTSAEANMTATRDMPLPNAPTDIHAVDNDNIYVGVDGRDFTVNWTVSTSDGVTEQEIYILPTGTFLNMLTHTPVATFADNTTNTWTGGAGVTKDSAGNNLTGGTYKVEVPAVSIYGKHARNGADVTVVSDSAPPNSTAPELAAVIVEDDDASDNKTSITMPAVPAGATKFLYVVSGDANAVPTPNVGTDWTANVSNTLTASQANLVVIADGKNVGIAAVDANNLVVKFINVVAVTQVEGAPYAI